MSDQLKEARTLFSEFDKAKNIDAFIQGILIVLDINESSKGREKKIADNLFNVYWDSALKWTAQLRKSHEKEIESTMATYIDQGEPAALAELIRLCDIVSEEEAQKVSAFFAFLMEMIREGKSPS